MAVKEEEWRKSTFDEGNWCKRHPLELILSSTTNRLLSLLCLHSVSDVSIYSWLGGSVVERRSLTGELSLVCT